MNGRLFTLVLFVTLTSISCSIAPDAPPASSYACTDTFAVNNKLHPKDEQLSELLSNIQKQGLPGVAVLIEDADGYWTSGIGQADIAANAGFRPCTLTAIGSITKTYIATLALKLQELSLIDLDARAADWLDADIVAKIDNLDQATLRQLLNHSAGIFNYTDNLAYLLDLAGNTGNDDYRPSIHDRLAYAYGKPAYFPVGKGHTYSNTGYLLVDLMLQAMTGKSLEQLFQQYMFTPLSLNNSVYETRRNYNAGQAQGYLEFYGTGKIRNNTRAEGGGRTAHGGVMSNVFDMYTLMQAITDPARGFLMQSSIDEMQTWLDYGFNNTSTTMFYGLGLARLTGPTGTILLHTGRLGNGYNADLR